MAEKRDYYEVLGVSKTSTSDEIKAQGGYEWTPATSKDETIDRNDPVRLAYERGWVYESPDNGKTVTKRRVGETQKYPVK